MSFFLPQALIADNFQYMVGAGTILHPHVILTSAQFFEGYVALTTATNTIADGDDHVDAYYDDGGGDDHILFDCCCVFH